MEFFAKVSSAKSNKRMESMHVKRTYKQVVDLAFLRQGRSKVL